MTWPAPLYMTLFLIFCALPTTEARMRGSNMFHKDEANTVEEDFIIIFDEKPSTITLMGAKDFSSYTDKIQSKYALKKKKIYSNTFHGLVASNLTKQDIENIKKEDGVYLVEKDEIISIDKMEHEVGIPSLSLKYRKKIFQSYGNLKFYSNKNDEVIPPGVEEVGWKNIEKDKKYRKRRVFVIDTGVTKTRELNVDQMLARNFISGESRRNWEDCSGHGTHVASIIAAKLNGKGVVGIAAGAVIVPIRAMGCGAEGSMSDIVKAVEYVGSKAKPGDVVNLSLGVMSDNVSLDLAISKAASKSGAKFVIAAGNKAHHSMFTTPARVNGKNIYTVCALGLEKKRLANYTNYGKPPIDVCAPGTLVMALSLNDQLAITSGTSMAAPHVTGALFLGSTEEKWKKFAKGPGGKYPIVRI